MRTLYYNGFVYTGQLPLQQAFQVEDEKFSAVGTNEALWPLETDTRVDLQGAFVCAGFNDSHLHLLNLGQTLTIAPLFSHTGSLEELIQTLARWKPGRGGWIQGRGWNQDYFGDVHRMPNRWDLDRASVDHPICAVRACGHALCANSKALELLGMTDDVPDVPGGYIGMENGVPNGLFFDNAMDLVLSKIPSPDKADMKDMILAACKKLNACGITSCQSDDYCVFQNVPWQAVNKAYLELEAAGELTVRVYEQENFSNVNRLADFLDGGKDTGTDLFRIGPLKLLGDGALGARTAYLSRPYADDPATAGISVFSPEEFDALIGHAHKNGMQVAVHCIGDACLDLVLNSIEKALAANPRGDHRHGIVHCQITRPDQLKRIAGLRLHVYAQSIFLHYDMHIVGQRVGDGLAQSSYSWKTLKNMGASVSNSSDSPVEQPDVLAGIQCAVTRCDLDGNGPYLPEEAFTLEEALESYTAAGAYASFDEGIKGSISPGMLADFVVLGANPFETDPFSLKDIPVLQTFLGGKNVYPG